MSKKIKLLYVDDQPTNLQVFRLMLKNSEFEILTMDNCQDAIHLLHESPDIDLVFSDMQMPETSGLEFISDARKSYPEKKYILLTSHMINSDIHDAMDNGLIDKYITKPLSRNILLRTINSLMTG